MACVLSNGSAARLRGGPGSPHEDSDQNPSTAERATASAGALAALFVNVDPIRSFR